MQSLLAGEIAQQRYNPRSVKHYHGASDYSAAIDILTYFTYNQRELEAWLKSLHIRTEDMLFNPNAWRAVERLAAELMHTRTIRGKEATEIIHEGFLVPPRQNAEERSASRVRTTHGGGPWKSGPVAKILAREKSRTSAF
ncbi:MAG: hypothetical protein ACLP7O_03240 [Terracidiphilus sp.]